MGLFVIVCHGKLGHGIFSQTLIEGEVLPACVVQKLLFLNGFVTLVSMVLSCLPLYFLEGTENIRLFCCVLIILINTVLTRMKSESLQAQTQEVCILEPQIARHIYGSHGGGLPTQLFTRATPMASVVVWGANWFKMSHPQSETHTKNVLVSLLQKNMPCLVCGFNDHPPFSILE